MSLSHAALIWSTCAPNSSSSPLSTYSGELLELIASGIPLEVTEARTERPARAAFIMESARPRSLPAAHVRRAWK
jgi:hypothetical protein